MVLDFSISLFLVGKWRHKLLVKFLNLYFVKFHGTCWKCILRQKKKKKKIFNILIKSGDIVKWILSKFYF